MSNKVKIHVLGPMCSGTNLMYNIIEEHIKTTMQIDLPSNIEVTQSEIWKHTTNKNTIEKQLNNKDKNNNKTVGCIFMYKNIYNWLYSIKKTPYETNIKRIIDPVIFDNNVYPNAVCLYNSYYNMYKSMLTNTNHIFIDYYKIIQEDKNKCCDYINKKLIQAFGFSIENDIIIKQLNIPSKNHGDPVKNSLEALNKYESTQSLVRNYINKYTKLGMYIDNTIINYYEEEEE